MLISTNLLRKLDKFKSASQRFALMIVAVPSSYAIDTYFSGTKDEKTKANARIKNISKAIACGIVGVGVRLLCDLGVNKFTQIGEIRESNGKVENAVRKKLRGCLLPNLEQRTRGMTVKALKIKRNTYVSFGANALALFVMIFTNVFLDAPLTKLFAKFGIERFGYPAKKQETSRKNIVSSEKEGMNEKA